MCSTTLPIMKYTGHATRGGLPLVLCAFYKYTFLRGWGGGGKFTGAHTPFGHSLPNGTSVVGVATSVVVSPFMLHIVAGVPLRAGHPATIVGVAAVSPTGWR